MGTRAWLRPADDEDEGVLFEVFSSTWQREVAAMPDPSLAPHMLRIQYTAQNERFAARFPGFERSVVMLGDEPVGRLYLHRSGETIHIVDMTLLPAHRGHGLGTQLLHQVMDEATGSGRTVTLRVARVNARAIELYERAGFRLVSVDDLDLYLEWTPPLRAV